MANEKIAWIWSYVLEHNGKAGYKKIRFLEGGNNKIFHFSFIFKSKNHNYRTIM